MSLNIIASNVEMAAVDYFTVTERLNADSKMYPIARDIGKELDQRHKQKHWRFFGYEGWAYYGNGDFGHFAYGTSQSEVQGQIVQASGFYARAFVNRFLGAFERWSRIDLCVDVVLSVPAPDIATDYFNWILNKGEMRRQYSVIQNNFGGSTLYVGSRTSEDFGRVYDKGIQEDNAARQGVKWRYEVELKGQRARACAQSLQSLGLRSQKTVHPIAVTVWDWFDRRDIPPIWKRQSTEALDLKVTGETKGQDAKLLWLQKQVAPTVREMLSDNRREVLDALGITDYYTLRRKR